MATTPLPMRDAQGMQLPPQWDGNQPFYKLDNGGKRYLSPMEILGLRTAAQRDGTPVDPRVDAALGTQPTDNLEQATTAASGQTPDAGLIKSRGAWNDQKGKFDQGTNWGNIMAMGVGGAMAAPLVMGALGGAAGGGAAGGGAASATIPTTSLAGGVAGGAGALTPTAAFGAAGATGAAGAGAAAAAPALASSTVPGAGVIGAVPGAGATPFANLAGGTLANTATTPGWGKVLQEGGQALTSAAQSSANEDAANNVGSAAWLRAMDDDYQTKLRASVNAPAGLQRQALWSDYGMNAKTSNPSNSPTSLLAPSQVDMLAAQKAEIMKKLADANKMALPVAPETPKFQAPGAGTRALSTLGTVANVASRVPWSKVLSYL